MSCTCDLCGSDSADFLAEGRRFGVQTTNVVCRGCGFVYQHPRPSTEDLADFYRQRYRVLYSGSAATPPSGFVKEQAKKGAEILELCRGSLPAGASVLDVGCGPGGTLLPFRDAGHRVLGIEPGAYGEWGRIHLDLDIRTGVLGAVDLDGFRPDLLLLSFVLEHVESPRAMLRLTHETVSADGLVYVSVPNLRRMRGAVGEYFHLAHLSYFTEGTLAAMLEVSGFRPVVVRAKGPYAVSILARRLNEAKTGGGKVIADDPSDIRRMIQRQEGKARVEGAIRKAAQPLLDAMVRIAKYVGGEHAAGQTLRAAKALWRLARYGGR